MQAVQEVQRHLSQARRPSPDKRGQAEPRASAETQVGRQAAEARSEATAAERIERLPGGGGSGAKNFSGPILGGGGGGGSHMKRTFNRNDADAPAPGTPLAKVILTHGSNVVSGNDGYNGGWGGEGQIKVTVN